MVPQKIVPESKILTFTISYNIPETYDDSKEMVRNAGGIKIPLNMVHSLPLRHNTLSTWQEDRLYKSGVDRVYYAPRACDGAEGSTAQLLMQPEGSVFSCRLAILTIHNLGLNPKNLIGDLYRRAEEIGLKKCPITILPAISILGIPSNFNGNFAFMTDTFKWNHLDRIYVLRTFGKNGIGPRFELGSGYSDFEIRSIGDDWFMAIIQPMDNGAYHITGIPETAPSFYFVFMVPDDMPVDIINNGLFLE